MFIEFLDGASSGGRQAHTRISGAAFEPNPEQVPYWSRDFKAAPGSTYGVAFPIAAAWGQWPGKWLLCLETASDVNLPIATSGLLVGSSLSANITQYVLASRLQRSPVSGCHRR